MDYINIGILANTHGLKGEVKIKSLSDFAELRFAKGKQIYVVYQSQYLPLIVEHVRSAKGMLIVKFEGLNNINQVELWKGSMLVLPLSELHELADDEAYYFELTGALVETREGVVLGHVIEVLETGANAILRVQGEKMILIPYVKAFVKAFDKETKRMVVELMEGML